MRAALIRQRAYGTLGQQQPYEWVLLLNGRPTMRWARLADAKVALLAMSQIIKEEQKK